MRITLILAFLFLITACSVSKRRTAIPKTEFRGVWIASVVNIDWPKSGTDPAAKQKQDFIEILDFYQNLNFNAAIVQIRTAGDAFYPTEMAPWSKYLTGKEGQPPTDFDHPLQWMIDETHKRGMEFHAWLNPYRATFDLDTLALAPSHDYYQHPEWMIKYGKKYYYNPGLQEVQTKLTQLISEIVENYKVDAIHFDDYFYPYKIKDEVFNDSLSYTTYGLPNQNLEDWRRSNVDSLVKNAHLAIKKAKPWVQFGISPFGVWKNNDTDPRGSATKAGQTTYEDLYADPLLWMEKGWLDYLVPQVYWSMDYPVASHRIITEWWANQSTYSNLYVGNGTYKIRNNADKAWKRRNEIPKQLTLARNQAKISGNVFFSAKSLLGKNERVTHTLQRKFYRYPAQNPPVPQGPKRSLTAPNLGTISIRNKQVEICMEHKDTVPRFLQLYRSKNGFTDSDELLVQKTYISETENSACFSLKLSKYQLGVSVIDPYGNESKITPITIN
nr:family 10 glycosylhydrolase [Allomuricauda sp.]